jgi:hypothetical protein
MTNASDRSHASDRSVIRLTPRHVDAIYRTVISDELHFALITVRQSPPAERGINMIDRRTLSTMLMEVALATSIAVSAITGVSTPSLAGETHYRNHHIHRVSVRPGYDHG